MPKIYKKSIHTSVRMKNNSRWYYATKGTLTTKGLFFANDCVVMAVFFRQHYKKRFSRDL